MIKARCIWSAEALIDLEIIYDFLAINSQTSAQRVVSKILDRTHQLERYPESGPVQEGLQGTEL